MLHAVKNVLLRRWVLQVREALGRDRVRSGRRRIARVAQRVAHVTRVDLLPRADRYNLSRVEVSAFVSRLRLIIEAWVWRDVLPGEIRVVVQLRLAPVWYTIARAPRLHYGVHQDCNDRRNPDRACDHG